MQPRAPVNRRHRGRRIAIATLLATTWVSTGVASAHGGGGVGTPAAPALSGVSCLERCGDLRKAAAGSVVELSGSGLDAVAEVKFVAAGGGRVGVAPSAVGFRSVEAKVPDGAATGTVRVVAYGMKAETPPDQPLEIVDADQLPAPGAFKLTAAEATPHHTYFDGRRKPKVAYVFDGAAATDVRVEVVDRSTKTVVTSFVAAAAQPAAQNVAIWNGRLADGSPAPDGDYRFRLGSVSGGHTATTGESRPPPAAASSARGRLVAEAEGVALTHDVAERRRGEVRGAHEHVALAVAVQERATRLGGLLGIEVGPRHPRELEELDGRMDEIARDDRLLAA